MGNANAREATDAAAAPDGRPIPQMDPMHQRHLQQHPQHRGGAGGSEVGRLSRAGSSESFGHLSDSPGGSARSPLMFTPQIPMTPIGKPDEYLTSPYQYGGMYGSDQQAGEKGIPSMIVWSHGGNSVLIEGSWDNWATREPMQRSGKDFTILKVLPAGVYQTNFIVDGEWTCSPDLPRREEGGNVTNVLEVQDHVPENLDNVVGFEPPPSPDSSYTDPFPGPEDYAKEPPQVPPHLHLTLLNVPPLVEAPGTLPRPQHVILNHLYVEKGKQCWHWVLLTGSEPSMSPLSCTNPSENDPDSVG